MRPIKFRGKTLGNNQWVYGSLIIPSDHQSECIIENEGSWYVEPDTVGQFTGLHDIKGKEIYEGDVIGSTGVRHQIVYDNYRAAFIAKGIGNRAYWLIGKDWVTTYEKKVIGNMYDSPELLSESK
jgi:uncharacterized phage protein (TIGR01671 family)